MKINRAASTLKTDAFQTSDRETTRGIVVAYTDTIADPRIDAEFLDWTDASRAYLGCTYHFVVRVDGTAEIGRSPRTISSRIKKTLQHDHILIGVVGGRDEEGNRVTTITDAQRNTVELLMQKISDALQVPLEVTDHVENKRLRDEAAQAEHVEDELEQAMDAAEQAG